MVGAVPPAFVEQAFEPSHGQFAVGNSLKQPPGEDTDTCRFLENPACPHAAKGQF